MGSIASGNKQGRNELKCPQCGETVPSKGCRRYNGRILCPSCYQQYVFGYDDLLEYIKQKFDLLIVPSDWEDILKKFIAEGKSFEGIKQTLQYYYDVLGNSTDSTTGLWCIKSNYGNADRYFKELDQVIEYNKTATITSETVNIVLEPPKLKTKIPKYDISKL